MGIPSFFGWLSHHRELKRILHPRLTAQPRRRPIRRLYFDFNCLIHRACKEEGIKTKDEMIENVLRLTDEVIAQVNDEADLKSLELIYIAIDGSVPMGKCKQQRHRRFKSLLMINNETAGGKKSSTTTSASFDFNAISPGTVFMDEIKEALQVHYFGFPVKVIISDSWEPGEGEHKIVRHFKTYPTKEPILIYGLDADLIFLSLSLHHPSTFLIRENTFGEEIDGERPSYLFVDIGSLYSNIIELILGKKKLWSSLMLETTAVMPATTAAMPATNHHQSMIKEIVIGDDQKEKNQSLQPIQEEMMMMPATTTTTMAVNPRRLMEDYIVIHFLLGNDFVSRVFCLHIKNKGCELIIELYRQTRQELHQRRRRYVNDKDDEDEDDYYLVSRDKKTGEVIINLEWMIHFLNKVIRHKEANWYTTGTDRYYARRDNPESVPAHLHYLPRHCSKEDYYRILMDDDSDDAAATMTTADHQRMELSSFHYLQSIMWTANYYLNNRCLDYDYYYPYHYSPLLSDLVDYLSTTAVYHTNGDGRLSYQARGSDQEVKEAIHPYHQLMLILPKASYHLLPSQYRSLFDHPSFNRFFPSTIKLIHYGHRFLWECPPLLPIISYRSTRHLFSHLY